MTVDDLFPLLSVPLTDDNQSALDDLVHDLAERDDTIDTSGEDDPDAVLDMRSYWASELNNTGVYEQLRYCLTHANTADVIAAVVDSAVSAHAKTTLLAAQHTDTP